MAHLVVLDEWHISIEKDYEEEEIDMVIDISTPTMPSFIPVPE